MAANAAGIFNSDIAVATTGAAGPTAHNGKAAGTMFVAIYYQQEIKIIKFKKNYGREMNRFYA
ncbi:MAG: CinA family protein, partial [Desulfovermiculus sp.]